MALKMQLPSKTCKTLNIFLSITNGPQICPHKYIQFNFEFLKQQCIIFNPLTNAYTNFFFKKVHKNLVFDQNLGHSSLFFYLNHNSPSAARKGPQSGLLFLCKIFPQATQKNALNG